MRFPELAPLLPQDKVGNVLAIEPIRVGLSGADVYAVKTTRGELVLRVQPERAYARHWLQQLLVLQRAAAGGIAPALWHIDDAKRAIVSTRVQGMPLGAALGDPSQRNAAIGSLVAQLRALHALDPSGVSERDPMAFTRTQYAAQRTRAHYPRWASELEPVLAKIEATLSGDARRAVSHNDVNPSNVLWDGTRAWLVDWEVAGVTHPFYDLAALAMFIQLEDGAAHALLELQEQKAIDDADRATFGALRQLVGLLCGLTFLSLVPDLEVLPAEAATMADFYAELRAGKIDLQTARGQGAYGLALLARALG